MHEYNVSPKVIYDYLDDPDNKYSEFNGGRLFSGLQWSGKASWRRKDLSQPLKNGLDLDNSPSILPLSSGTDLPKLAPISLSIILGYDLVLLTVPQTWQSLSLSISVLLRRLSPMPRTQS